jgi:hypothetical protein
MERTLERLGLDSDEEVRQRTVRLRHVGLSVVYQILTAVEDHVDNYGRPPGVIMVDGLDFCAEDANKMRSVFEVLDGLAEIIEHYHIALVGTVGAPKRKREQGTDISRGYVARVDELYGSSAWGRASETTIHVTQDDEEVRRFWVMHRGSKDEVFYMKFNHQGRLESCPKPEVGEAPNHETEWMTAQTGYWDRAAYEQGVGVKTSKAQRRLGELVEGQVIHVKPGPQGKAKLYRLGPTPNLICSP